MNNLGSAVIGEEKTYDEILALLMVKLGQATKDDRWPRTSQEAQELERIQQALDVSLAKVKELRSQIGQVAQGLELPFGSTSGVTLESLRPVKVHSDELAKVRQERAQLISDEGKQALAAMFAIKKDAGIPTWVMTSGVAHRLNWSNDAAFSALCSLEWRGLLDVNQTLGGHTWKLTKLAEAQAA